MRIIPLLLLQIICLSLYSQKQMGCLMLRIFPYDAINKVDGVQYSKRGQGGFMYIKLKSGEHKIQAWSPSYNLLDSNVSIAANDTLKITLGLSKSDEYLEYKKKKNVQSFAKVTLIAVPSFAVVGFTAGYFIKQPQKKNELEDALAKVEMDRVDYEKSISIDAISDAKMKLNQSIAEYDKAVTDYNKFVTNSTIKIGTSAVFTGLAIWYVSKFKKIEFQEESLIGRVQLQIDPVSYAIGFKWRILK